MKGEDLHARVEISLEDAYAGTMRNLSPELPELDEAGRVASRPHTFNVKFPKGVTLGRRVDLRIPPGLQSGARLRLKDRGLPGTPPGDQFTVLDIVTPKADTDRTRALYEQMKREMAFDPRSGLGG